MRGSCEDGELHCAIEPGAPSTPEASPGSVQVRRSFSECWNASDPYAAAFRCGAPAVTFIQSPGFLFPACVGTTVWRGAHLSSSRRRKLGFISYNGKLEVHYSLLNAAPHDAPQPRRGGLPVIMFAVRAGIFRTDRSDRMPKLRIA